jgi:hypothetical protein
VATWTCLKTLSLRAVRLPPYFAWCPQHLQRGFYNQRGVRALSGRNRVFKQELVWSNVSRRRVNSPHFLAAGKNPVPCKTNALCECLLWLFVLEAPAPAPVPQRNTDHTTSLTGLLHRYKRMTHHTYRPLDFSTRLRFVAVHKYANWAASHTPATFLSCAARTTREFAGNAHVVFSA